MPTSDSRWRDLEERVRVLEERLTRADPRSASEDVATDDFWIVNRLRTELRAVADGGVVFAGTVRVASGAADWQYGRTTEDLVHADPATQALAAERLSALGHPVRLKLLLAVLDGHTSPSALADLEGMGTTGQIYHHIRTLTAAGWLRSAGRNALEVPAERVVPALAAIAAAL